MARANRSNFAMALDEFVDEFYLDHPDKAAQQARLDPIPEPVGDPLADAWIGAVGEHLALRWGLRTPDWTQRAAHFALEEPHFLPDGSAASSSSKAPRPSARGSSSPGPSRWPAPASRAMRRGHRCRSHGRRPRRARRARPETAPNSLAWCERASRFQATSRSCRCHPDLFGWLRSAKPQPVM